MEENELYDRIGETDLNPTYKDGQTYQHTDINQMLGILKTAINENYYDIQRLLNGAKTVENANQLDGATLSRYLDETLQADDNKVPSSQQAKAYMDELFAGYSAPVRGEDYWTDADKEEIIDDAATAVVEEITPSFEEALAAKANINDIPTKISDLQNDSDFLSENNLQMVNTVDVQNGSQITDATGYGRLNEIHGDTSQTGNPTPTNLVDVDVVTGDVTVVVSNSDSSLSQTFLLPFGELELCKLGDYHDVLYQRDGKWYKHTEIGKYILDHTAGWYVSYGAIKYNHLHDTKKYPLMHSGYNYNAATTLPLYSNYGTVLPAKTIVSSSTAGYVGLSDHTNGGGNADAIYVAKGDMTLDYFKGLLAQNPIICYYILETPTEEEITDANLIDKLNFIYNFSLYQEETNFTVTSDNLTPVLNITYAITNRDIYSKEETDDIIKNNIESNYIIDEISYEKITVENGKGTVFITKIPHVDNNNNIIPIKHGFANDKIDNGMETTTSFSSRNKATFAANSSVFEITGTEHIALNELKGVYIHDGEVIKDNRQYCTSSFLSNRYILGIKENNVLKAYKGDTSVQTLLNDGVKETVQAFIPILVNGVNNKSNLELEGCTYWSNSTFSETSDTVPLYNKIYYTLENGEYNGHYHLDAFEQGVTYFDETTTFRYNRQIICQKENGDILFITNNGKGSEYNIGLSLYDFVTIAKYYGCTFAFVLDGGGSTSSVYRNEMLNHPTDKQTNYSQYYNGLGYTEREVPDFLYFSKDVKTKTDETLNYLLTKVQELNKRIDDLSLTEDNKFMSNTYFYQKAAEQHIFNFRKWDSALKTFRDTFRMYIDNVTSFEGGISFNHVDSEGNSIPVLRFGKDIGISFLSRKLGLLYNNIPEVSDATLDLDNLDPNFTAMRLNANLELNHQPFTYEESHVYWLIQWGDSYYKFQIAIAIKAIPIIRIRTKVDGTWHTWKNISVS